MATPFLSGVNESLVRGREIGRHLQKMQARLRRCESFPWPKTWEKVNRVAVVVVGSAYIDVAAR